MDTYYDEKQFGEVPPANALNLPLTDMYQLAREGYIYPVSGDLSTVLNR